MRNCSPSDSCLPYSESARACTAMKGYEIMAQLRQSEGGNAEAAASGGSSWRHGRASWSPQLLCTKLAHQSRENQERNDISCAIRYSKRQGRGRWHSRSGARTNVGTLATTKTLAMVPGRCCSCSTAKSFTQSHNTERSLVGATTGQLRGSTAMQGKCAQ